MTYSVNLGGVIFFVEADAYIALKNYLQSLHQYFAHIEDGQEILLDLQVRMAEILFENRPNREKQEVSFEDIKMIRQTLGEVKDFEEAAQNPAFQTTFEPPNNQKSIQKINNPIDFLMAKIKSNIETQKTTSKENLKRQKKLFRDIKRKKLGGVAAGLAYYFGINPLWIRLLWFISITSFPFASASLVIYILLWILMPAHEDLPEQKDITKIYRDSSEGILGGVTKGLSHYAGIPEIYIRIFFIIASFFDGMGFMLYIILWLLLPDPKSLTDKLSMKGYEIDPQHLTLLIEEYYQEVKNAKK
jgi:phage shock protein PspC (stress-responsive transcriptional regulator)